MKIAIIGAWHVHAKDYTKCAFENEQAELVCVFDKDETRGKELADEFNVPYVSDFESILNDKEIDSVVVTTATNEHEEVISALAKAGKNIFTEKVLAFTKKKAEQLAEIIEKANVKFTISYPHLTKYQVRALEKLVKEDVLGQINYMRVRNVHSGAIDNWLPDHFYDKEMCGGGAMMDLGAHPMYLLSHFMGEPKNISSTFTSVTNREVEDNAVSTIEFKNGAIGVSETGFISKNYPYMIELSGSKGCAFVLGNDVRYCCEKTDNQFVDFTGDMPEIMRPIDAWIDAVVNDTTAPYGTKEAIALSNLMEGAYISHEKGEKYYY